ncbi:hypothetical protein V5799_032808 [Amblyomma americanum]|uniref:Reverse transcriptase domain-containing protein n=1 Tax=Amblyomma americanum TaxID=6943 RepID=A0AAQ4DQ43_AMBAM
MNEGLITLLCKDQSRAMDLRAWRPITLLNSDYKIIAKCLSLRLTPALSSIVGPHQACCIPGRSVELHGIALKDMITWLKSRNLKGTLLSLHQKKAFDRLCHSYLFRQLKHARLNAGFISMTRALYAALRVAVIDQGRVSEQFSVTRGVRQGCPLSPLLYVIAIEPLL